VTEPTARPVGRRRAVRPAVDLVAEAAGAWAGEEPEITTIVSGPRVLTVTEAATVLRVSRATAYRLVDDGVLPVLRLRGRLKVPLEALENLLRSVDPTLSR
jgi:excisionase family DNA binding protein